MGTPVEVSNLMERGKWDSHTPQALEKDVESSSEWATEGVGARRRKWDATPIYNAGAHDVSEDATPRRKRWDATPMASGVSEFSVPADASVKQVFPTALSFSFTNGDLDEILPSDGFVTIDVNDAPSTAIHQLGGFSLSSGDATFPQAIFGTADLPLHKPEDYQFFGRLLEKHVITDDSSLAEAKEYKLLQLLLKIKNGDPPSRRYAMRTIVEKAKEFGAGMLMEKVLELLMMPSLEDHERHLIVKILDRILLTLDDLVRPFTSKILATLQPLLISDSYFIRSEGKEIIANLSKAAGLSCMIAALRPDIDHADENVRNNACRTFGILASTLGIKAVLPFLRAVCQSKTSWQARQSAMKIIQQIAISMGCSILTDLKDLVDCCILGLADEQFKTRTMAALSVAALAESSYPYGIDPLSRAFNPILIGVRQNRGKALSAYIKASGYLILLMDTEQSAAAIKDVLPAVVHEFRNSDEEMKRIVVRFLSQCLNRAALQASTIKNDLFPDFLQHFWTVRVASDRRVSTEIINIVYLIAKRIGINETVFAIISFFRDPSELIRKLTILTLENLFKRFGTASVDAKLEARIFDGLIFCFQEMQLDDHSCLKAVGNVFVGFEQRSKPYLTHLTNIVFWHLSNRSAKIRSNAAEMVSHITPVVQMCEEAILARLCVVLYENLGEEYPDVLASIIKALVAILTHIGINRCSPPIGEILLRVSPILRNRHERVQEATVEFVGLVAQRCPEAVSAREWMRISFELLELLRSPRRTVRRASVLSFGHIAKAIGPHDVLSALLNNLKVQERQNRVCTTVAIAIVADACSPFTVIPALMTEYRVPELNVQNGVLKAFAFLFEYIGELAKDYIFAVTPLLEDALIERDLVHRQIAAAAIKHMSLGVSGFGCEEALIHLLNLIWPNIFETSPHIINSIVEAIEAITHCLGPATLLQYSTQGLFHPARRVRDIYWRTFNTCYVSSADSLVAFYPRFPAVSSSANKLTRDVFDAFI